MRIQGWLLVSCAALLVGACDNKGSGGEATKPTAAPATAAPATTGAAPAVASAAPAKHVVELEIGSVGNEMKFDKTALTAPTGAEVHLVLKNNGTMAVMQHNWVLVKPGTEAKVAADGMNNAPDAGYVVPGSDVLAHTPLAAPGKTVEVTFTAPAPGTYPYICTFPGHYVLMKGVLTVTP